MRDDPIDAFACHRCAAEYDDADRARFRERQRQVERGEFLTAD